MKRRDDWNPQLRAYLKSISTVPFKTGKHDCATFVAGAVLAMTGVDPMRGFRGYRTAAEGQRRLQARGFTDLPAFAGSLFEEISNPTEAQVGDIAVVAGIGADAVGIVQGANIYTISAVGLNTVPLTAAKRAFRVG